MLVLKANVILSDLAQVVWWGEIFCHCLLLQVLLILQSYRNWGVEDTLCTCLLSLWKLITSY